MLRTDSSHTNFSNIYFERNQIPFLQMLHLWQVFSQQQKYSLL